MSKTNICFFLGSYGAGGAEDHVLQIVTNLNRDEFNISLVIFNARGKNRDAFHDQGINIFELVVYENKFVKHFIRIFDFIPITKFLVQNNISVVHIHLVGIYLTSMLASIFAGVKNRIITWHNVYDDSVIKWTTKNIWINIKFLFRVKLTSTLSNNIIGVSQKVVDSNIKYFHIKRKKVITVHNGIKPNNQIRKLEQNKQQLKIIAVGSLTEQKGYFVMLQALSKVVENGSTNIILHIFGDGPLFDRLNKEIIRLKLNSYVKLKGRVNNIPSILPEYDVYLNTSFHEGFSIAVLEAMNAQLAIIATSVGGTPEAIINNRTGLLVPSNDIDAISDAIIKLEKNSELLNQLALSARKEFIQKFSIGNMMEGLVKIYTVE